MFTLSRRNFLQGAALAPLTLAAPGVARAQAPLVVRHDASSPAGLEMLEVLAGAVAAMKSIQPRHPHSWQWQWYTHFVDGNTTKEDEIIRLWGSPDANRRSALAEEVWNTCQPHGGQNANFFLPWHRMFVYFFEGIVREVSGRPDFALPYWNYTSSDPALRGVLPEAFRLPDDPLYGSLYRPDRNAQANNGQPIHSGQPGDAMDISVPMAKANYMTSGVEQGFCRALDSGVHGNIHVLVGTAENMGRVPFAARDPLFWVHHANIDRLWASWNANGGVNPRDNWWSRQQFAFANAGTWREIRRGWEFFDTEVLGYTYDDFIPPPAPDSAASRQAAATATRGSRGSTQLVARAGPVELGSEPRHTTLRPVAGTAPTEVLGLADGSIAAADGQRTYLILKDLHTWTQPEVLYHVYLTPGNSGQPPGRSAHVGVINFFDAEFHDHGSPKMDEALGENFYSFDVTGILRDMARRRNRNARDALSVTLVPGGRPTTGAKPLVATIELARQ
ncbi:MAG: tyrosinase family protein [Lysobacter sp.]